MKTIDEPMPICEAEMERLETIGGGLQIAGHGGEHTRFPAGAILGWMDELADESSGDDDSSPECRLSRNGAGALAIAMQRPWRCVTRCWSPSSW